MKSRLPLLILAIGTWSIANGATDDLPVRDANERLDFEPDLMLNDLPDLPPPAPAIATPSEADLQRLEAGLKRAKANAEHRERLWKEGVLAKVDAEQSALKVVHLTADWQRMRALVADQKLEALKKNSGDPSAKSEIAKAQEEAAAAERGADEAQTAWKNAERTAAELNLERNRKLLAAGVGSKAMVKRAEERLATLQIQSPN